MAAKPRRLSKNEAPDPSDVYERSHPEHEAGMGEMGVDPKAKPSKSTDKMPAAVKHAQDGSRQINAHDDLQLPASPAKKQNASTESVGWRPTKNKKK
jgi:hypothetical protein